MPKLDTSLGKQRESIYYGQEVEQIITRLEFRQA